MGASGTVSMPRAMHPGFDPRRAGATGHWQDASAPGQMAFYDGAAYDRGLLYYRAGEFGAYHPAPGYGVSGVYGGVPASQPAAFHPAALNPAAAYGNANQWTSWEHHAARFGGAGVRRRPRGAGAPRFDPGRGSPRPVRHGHGRRPSRRRARRRLERGVRRGRCPRGGAPRAWRRRQQVPAGPDAQRRGGDRCAGRGRAGARHGCVAGRPSHAGARVGVPRRRAGGRAPRAVARGGGPAHRARARRARFRGGARRGGGVRGVRPGGGLPSVLGPQSGCGARSWRSPPRRARARRCQVGLGRRAPRAGRAEPPRASSGEPVAAAAGRGRARAVRAHGSSPMHRASREEDVRAFFQTETADVTGVLLNPRVGGQVAFVEFATVDAAQAALRRSGRELDGRALRVSQSKTPLRLGGAKGHGAGRASAGGVRAFARPTTSGPGPGPAPPSEPAPPGQRTARGHNNHTLGSAPPPVLARTGARGRISGASVGSSGSGERDPRRGTASLSPGNPPRMWHAVRVSACPRR